MRQFYQLYPIGATLSHQFSWSIYVELLKIDDPLERSFYEQQSRIENWNVRELIRQKSASLFLRLAASKDKEGILKLAQERQSIEKPTDLIRIVLAREKDELLVQYAMHNISSQLFVSKYQRYLPNKEELQALISRQFDPC